MQNHFIPLTVGGVIGTAAGVGTVNPVIGFLTFGFTYWFTFQILYPDQIAPGNRPSDPDPYRSGNQTYVHSEEFAYKPVPLYHDLPEVHAIPYTTYQCPAINGNGNDIVETNHYNSVYSVLLNIIGLFLFIFAMVCVIAIIISFIQHGYRFIVRKVKNYFSQRENSNVMVCMIAIIISFIQYGYRFIVTKVKTCFSQKESSNNLSNKKNN